MMYKGYKEKKGYKGLSVQILITNKLAYNLSYVK